MQAGFGSEVLALKLNDITESAFPETKEPQCSDNPSKLVSTQDQSLRIHELHNDQQ